MNRNKPLPRLFYENKLRKAFICLKHRLRQRKEDERRMKTKIAAIILAVMALTSLTLAMGSAYAVGATSLAAKPAGCA
jgi:hypothetical protein